MSWTETKKALHLWNRGHWRDYIFSQGMLFIASLLLVFFISIGLGVQNLLDRFLSSDLPAEQVRVTPGGVQAGFFQTESGGIEITEDVKSDLENSPLVERIDPQIYAHVPAALRGMLGGQPYYTDITLEGVTGEFLGDSLLEDIDWSYTLSDSSTRFLPIILSENLLLVYNAGFAESNDLIGLTPEGVLGTECTLTLGRSSIASMDLEPVTVRARIEATSRNMNLFAIGVPFEFVEQINNLYLPDDDRRYSALVITAKNAEDVPEIVRMVEERELHAETRRGIAQKAEILVGAVTAALSALAAAILLSALSSAIHTLVMDLKNRRFALGVLMALGTPHDRLALIFAFQIFFMSFITMVLGSALGCLLAWGASSTLLSLSPVLRAAVDTLAVFPVGWLSAGIGLMLLTSTGIAYLFFERILKTPVTRLLRP
jgi:ABC-type antimicrobial peptide transport system permease subunit